MLGSDALEILDVALQMLTGALGTWLVVRWDESRLDPERLERAWPASTRLAAAVAFGPLAVPVHFWRTRRSVLGTLLGFAWTAALMTLSVIISLLLELLRGSP